MCPTQYVLVSFCLISLNNGTYNQTLLHMFKMLLRFIHVFSLVAILYVEWGNDARYLHGSTFAFSKLGFLIFYVYRCSLCIYVYMCTVYVSGTYRDFFFQFFGIAVSSSCEANYECLELNLVLLEPAFLSSEPSLQSIKQILN